MLPPRRTSLKSPFPSFFLIFFSRLPNCIFLVVNQMKWAISERIEYIWQQTSIFLQMIISDKYRYVFIELPLTASTAVAKELIENYDGRQIINKHANYRKFLKVASEDQKKYFSFAGVRNPLDKAVSHYFKYVSDHKNKYSEPPKKPGAVNPLKYFIDHSVHQKKFKFVQENDASFSEFFMQFYNIPYSDWSLLDHKKMDSVIFFEDVANGFEKTINKMGITPVRPLPQNNRTSLKEKVFWDYFDTSESQIKAAQIFGPYMKYWDYKFPSEWTVDDHVNDKESSYAFYNSIKQIYWSL